MKVLIPIITMTAAVPAGACQIGKQMPDIGQGPTAFETRDEGGSSQGGVTISGSTPPGKPRKIQLIAVCESRDWRNTEGQIIRASLLAHETNPDEEQKHSLTLVRDGKVRLLVDGRKQFSDYPLSKLSAGDQAFVAGLVRARKAAEAAAVKVEGPE